MSNQERIDEHLSKIEEILLEIDECIKSGWSVGSYVGVVKPGSNTDELVGRLEEQRAMYERFIAKLKKQM